jgi:hypothetical protein
VFFIFGIEDESILSSFIFTREDGRSKSFIFRIEDGGRVFIFRIKDGGNMFIFRIDVGEMCTSSG